MVVSAGRLTKEMRNSYRYLREGFSGKYLALYMIMENGVFVIIVDGVEEDLRTLGIRGWRRRALDRDRWKEVLTAARAQNGL